MMHHNYTNQGFCQDDEIKFDRSQSVRSVHRYPTIMSVKQDGPIGVCNVKNSSPNLAKQPLQFPHTNCKNVIQNVMSPTYDPRRLFETKNQSSASRYAVVPMEYLRKSRGNIYGSTTSFLSRSQENLFSSRDPMNINNITIDGSENFSSLPPMVSQNHPQSKNYRGMKSAFSNDFGSKSFIMLDQKYYEIIPTEENEEIVDENHEIIQVHPNGETHRYAVIPSSPDVDEDYSDKTFRTVPVTNNHRPLIRNCEPKMTQKNSPATQKLHELLTTPVKNSHPPSRTSSCLSPKRIISSPYKQTAGEPISPRKLSFDQRSLFMASSSTLNVEQRTTAVIQPRLNTVGSQIYNECSTLTGGSDQNTSSLIKKFDSRKKTISLIGYTSIILMILGSVHFMLCIYISYKSSVTNLYTGKWAYSEIGLLSAVATFVLSGFGYKYRFSPWTPNRNYVSGFILAALFSSLNVIGLIFFVVLSPQKGTPLHDVITGIVSALSSLILLFICLGFVSSRLCQAPPIDARVEVL